MHILSRSFYERDTPEVAQDLLGKLLVHEIHGQKVIGIIAETEAYRADDQASHAFRGRTKANSNLFGKVGHAYLYISYGIHTCLNTVAYDSTISQAGGVLIRGIIPLHGIELMIKLRHGRSNVGRGPGNVTQAMGISMDYNGIDLTHSSQGLYITTGYELNNEDIQTSPRIGISKNKEIHWRFFISTEKIKSLKEHL